MLFQMVLGDVPAAVAGVHGRHTSRFFTSSLAFRHSKLPSMAFDNFVVEKYGMAPTDAEALCAFLLPLLHYDPLLRPSPAEALRTSPWLKVQEPRSESPKPVSVDAE